MERKGVPCVFSTCFRKNLKSRSVKGRTLRYNVDGWLDEGAGFRLLSRRSCQLDRLGAEMSFSIPIDRSKIGDFCRRWKIVEFSLFGSVLRANFRPDSDVDVLVTFAPDAHWSLFDLVHMVEELKEIFGRQVDLVSRRGIESSRNYIRRKAILTSADVVYVA